MSALPPLAGEDHTCGVCALVYSEVSTDDALSAIGDRPAAVGKAVRAIPPEVCRRRPSTTGFDEEVARSRGDDWNRVATRLPDEQRTARWLVRQAMHEGVHQLGDIRRIGGISG